MKIRIVIIAASLLVALFTGCTTVPEQETETEYDAVQFLAEGEEALTRPALDDFLELINTRGEDFPETRIQLLEKYAAVQYSLCEYMLEEEDVFTAFHYFKNLAAVSEFHSLDAADLKKRIVDQAESRRYDYFVSHVLDRDLPPKDSGSRPSGSAGTNITVEQLSGITVMVHVSIEYENNEGILRKDRYSGSGFFIDPSHILTNYHVVEDIFADDTIEGSVTIQHHDHMIPGVKVKAWDSINDLALLELNSPQEIAVNGYECLRSTADLSQGDTVFALGHPRGLTYTMTKGIISSLKRKAWETGQWIQVDCVSAPGMSGGMVFGEDHRIVGVITAGNRDDEFNYIIPADTIMSLIDTLRSGESIRTPWIGALPSELPSGYFRYEEGIPLRYIFPISPLKRYGVEPGYRLLSVNGRQADTIERVQEIITSCSAGNLVKLEMETDEEEPKTFWMELPRRPDFAITSATLGMDRQETLYAYFNFKITDEIAETKKVRIQGKTINMNFYRLVTVDEDSWVEDRGFRINDLIGFIYDEEFDHERYIEVIHIPAKIENRFFTNDEIDVDDYYYTFRKGKYDESIL